MPEKYQGLGFSLLYPETWKLDEDLESQALTLETPSGSFLTITACSDLESAFKNAQRTMESEYEEVENEATVAHMAEQTLQGVTQRFVYLDLIIASLLLKLDTGAQKFLIQIQGEDREVEQQQPVFDAILTSMCQSFPKA